MSDVNLLIFGCVVSFIAVAGGYVYLHECWTAQEQPSEPELQHVEADQQVAGVDRSLMGLGQGVRKEAV